MTVNDTSNVLTEWSPTSDTPNLVDSLLHDGGIIVRRLISPEHVDAIISELTPSVASRQPGFRGTNESSFYGPNTVRIQGLAAKSRTFVDAILLHPVLLAIVDAVLLQNCGDYWMSQAETIFIGPGEKSQTLHKDDINWSRAADLGINLQVSVLVAVGDYDADVGATMVVPKSHLVNGKTDFAHLTAHPIELEPGDALVYLGGLVHGGGANITADRVRRAIYVGYLLGWLTPEEAVSQSIPHDVAAGLPARTRELLGWANIHGNTGDSPVHSATQLWQLDDDDLRKSGGVFIHR